MKILLAVDGSACSEVATQEVAQRPWPPGSIIKIISVIELPPLPKPEASLFSNPYYIRLETRAQEQAQATTRLAVGLIRQQQQGEALTVSGETRPVSPPSQVILQLAETWGADMIVLGSHGQRGWKRDWLGSVSRTVAAQALCSVTIVRCGQQASYLTATV